LCDKVNRVFLEESVGNAVEKVIDVPFFVPLVVISL
jgi:hypothetical protein